MKRSITSPLVVIVFSILASCSGLSDLNAKKDSTNENEGAVKQEECSGSECAAQSESSPTFGKLGLAEHCTFNKVEAKGCFVCTPRELPQTMCVDVDENFDPAKSCEFDLDLMSCRVQASADPFEFDFSEQSQLEKIYSKIPFLLLGAKVLIGGKLADKPVVKDLLFSCFDSVIAHKKEVFTQGNLTAMLDEIAAHVKKAKPDFGDANIDNMKNVINGASKTLMNSYADGKMEDSDFLTFAHSIVKAMPQELVGNVLEELNIEEILASLQSTGNKDVIDELINNAGGNPDDVAAALRAE